MKREDGGKGAMDKNKSVEGDYPPERFFLYFVEWGSFPRGSGTTRGGEGRHACRTGGLLSLPRRS